MIVDLDYNIHFLRFIVDNTSHFHIWNDSLVTCLWTEIISFTRQNKIRKYHMQSLVYIYLWIPFFLDYLFWAQI